MHTAFRSAARSAAYARPRLLANPTPRWVMRPQLSAMQMQTSGFASTEKPKGVKKNPEEDADATASPSRSQAGSSAPDLASAGEIHASSETRSPSKLDPREHTTRSSAPTSIPNTPSLSLDFAPADASESNDGAERTGARSSKDSLSSIEKRQKRLVRSSMFMLAFGVVVSVVYMGREWTADELKDKKRTRELAPSTRYGRTKERFVSLFDFFSEPAWPELLPPPLPPPHQKPYTLLVSLDDLIVSSTWDRQHGWRTAKRPGVDYFIAYLSQFYEVVIFTSQHAYTAQPVVEKLDPYGFFISYKLFREATRTGKDGPVKDLSYLNRPLDKVILLDAHPEHAATHPENVIVMKPWKGQPGDRGLVEMIPFLESIGIYKPADVRPILKAYEGKDIPREYALKEAAEKKAVVEEWKARGGGKGLSGGGFTLSSLFGGKERGPAVPETYLEKARREAQAVYLQEQKYLNENKGEIERLMQSELEARTKEMGGTVFGMMAGFAPKPPPSGEERSSGEETGRKV